MGKAIQRVKSTGQLGIHEGVQGQVDALGKRTLAVKINIVNENFEPTGCTIVLAESDLEMYVYLI